MPFRCSSFSSLPTRNPQATHQFHARPIQTRAFTSTCQFHGIDRLVTLLARRPFKVVAVALANKMARIIWALLTKGGSKYRCGKRRNTRLSRTKTRTDWPARRRTGARCTIRR
ncbi:hypothetical protein DPM35_31605 [Mesorhizobium atlanticum]|uniref:IS110 family transposase n=1 Tax=Mesorhizobium atlanticum TaxID=2233532 RepID=A0A330GGY8_9HYPH|nr:hypothetical protein DPM35_31605 [Mesorhizobium atlanticum]